MNKLLISFLILIQSNYSSDNILPGIFSIIIGATITIGLNAFIKRDELIDNNGKKLVREYLSKFKHETKRDIAETIKDSGISNHWQLELQHIKPEDKEKIFKDTDYPSIIKKLLNDPIKKDSLIMTTLGIATTIFFLYKISKYD